MLDKHLEYCHHAISHPSLLGKNKLDRTLLSLVAAGAFYISISPDLQDKIPDLRERLARFAYALDIVSQLTVEFCEDDTIHISIIESDITHYLFGKTVLPRYTECYVGDSILLKVHGTIKAINANPTFKFNHNSIKNLNSFFTRLFSKKRINTITILREKLESVLGK